MLPRLALRRYVRKPCESRGGGSFRFRYASTWNTRSVERRLELRRNEMWRFPQVQLVYCTWTLGGDENAAALYPVPLIQRTDPPSAAAPFLDRSRARARRRKIFSIALQSGLDMDEQLN